MKKLCVLLSAALLLVAMPAFAGSPGKCPANAQACLNDWAGKRDMGWLGLEYDRSQEGVVKVKGITPESPAASAGFQVGDVVMAVNDIKMSDSEGLKKAKATWKPGTAVTYTVQRAGAEQKVTATLAKAPDNVFAAMLGAHMLENHAAAAAAKTPEKAAGSAYK